MQIKSPNLIADIGGTNARFALVSDPESQPFEARTLRCADYDTLVDATEAYLKQVNYSRPQHAAFSIATPVAGDFLEMTNHGGLFTIRQTSRLLRLESLKVINENKALELDLPQERAND